MKSSDRRLSTWCAIAGWVLIAGSFPVGGISLIVPFMPLAAEKKAAIAVAALIIGEIMFMVGVVLLRSKIVDLFRFTRVNTGQSFRGKTVGVVGATGGLGSEIIRVLLREGAEVVSFARNPAKLQHDKSQISHCIPIDLGVHQSIKQAAEATSSLDALIVATGIDVRKVLQSQSNTDIEAQIVINLQGPVQLTREFIKKIKTNGVIAHLGGFGDGTLALPFYSVDVATRAGLAAFSESMNRELRVENTNITVAYYCPEPADTEAERPYAGLWKKMGTPPVKPVLVAEFVLRAVLARRPKAIMGRQTWFATTLNKFSNTAADLAGLNQIAKQLKAFFGRR